MKKRRLKAGKLSGRLLQCSEKDFEELAVVVGMEKGFV